MAATGLDSTDHGIDHEKAAKNVVLMTRFAWAMMTSLHEINQDAFYEYKLRIGI